MSSLKATVNPSQKKIKAEAATYMRVVQAYMLANDLGEWEQVRSSRTSKASVLEKFKFYSERLDALLREKASPVRDLALMMLHHKLWQLATLVEEGI